MSEGALVSDAVTDAVTDAVGEEVGEEVEEEATGDVAGVAGDAGDAGVAGMQALREAAMRYLARARTSGEVRAFLVERGASGHDADAIVAAFVEARYVSDDEVAEALRDKAERNQWGAERLSSELAARMVGAEAMTRAMAAFHEAGDEFSRARRALDAMGEVAHAKAARALARLGHSEEAILAVLGLYDGDPSAYEATAD